MIIEDVLSGVKHKKQINIQKTVFKIYFNAYVSLIFKRDSFWKYH